MKTQLLLLLSSCSLLAGSLAVQSAPQAAPPDFNRDVKPILSEHCFKCHGPDSATVAAGLRLDTFEEATKDRKGRRGIAPKDLEHSWVITRVSMEEPDLRMPPPDSGVQPLSKDQIDTLRRWIAAGAKYDEHWSFVPPKKPEIPAVKDKAWPKNLIDRFVLARLEKEGLAPAPEADKATLLRRAHMALIGLPPTPEELDAFLKDSSPRAYEDAVDRLMASPAYGEHQARYWLDAIRYGDTHGLHLDNERSIYPYRDWLVNALNEDLPFDQFTIWQLAGDMLPNPTVEQLVATGYVRMNPTTSEGGAIEEEFLAKNTFDRVDTTSSVFLGLTIGCAKCHDHKFDPISQKDYYRLFAYFNSTADAPFDGNAFTPPPVARAANKDQQRQLAAFDAQIEALLAAVTQDEALAWLNDKGEPTPTIGNWMKTEAVVHKNFDEAFAGESPQTWKPFEYKLGSTAAVVGKENAYAYVKATITSPKARVLPIRVSSDDGVKAWVNGKLVHENKVLRGVGALDTFRANLNAGENELIVKIVNAGAGDGMILLLGDALSDRIDKAKELWNAGKPEDRKLRDLQALYLEAGPAASGAKYREVVKAKADLEMTIPQTLIAQELPQPRVAHILRRGEYNLKEEKVDRGIPAKLGTPNPDDPVNRLGLARWLVDAKNPLTARVFANRAWQHYFGNGIVKTADDFGAQGEWPVNKDLLDYLAVSFREGRWSMKALQRSIVTSATFRQASVTTKEKLDKDPENRLASRGPRFRLDAEVIRDSALAASGLLNRRMGGKGFKPYQPDGIWEAIAFLDSTTARYVRDKGDDIYRRSLYLFWKRTAPHPVMLSFDAPMRESCVVKRSPTNTPLQALTTMNEPMFVESSRKLAERIIKSAKSDAERLEQAYLLCYARKPSAAESSLLLKSLVAYREEYKAEPADAEKLLSVGDSPRDKTIPVDELAAWALVCSTLMNTDEFLTQH